MNVEIVALAIVSAVLTWALRMILQWADRRVSLEIKTRQDERALYDRGLEALRTQQVVEIERLRTVYEGVVESQANAQKSAVEHLMNLIQFGMPSRVEAVTEEREPDAATRISRRVTEETVARAVSELRARYKEIGVPVTDDELDAEARSIIMGGRWTAPASLAGMLKD